MTSQVAVKNTFLQVGPCGQNLCRPRGETCDAALLKSSATTESTATDLCVLQQTPSSEEDEELKSSDTSKNTTIMLRNIPNKYTQKMLLEVIDADFQGLYNFFYLPIDFKNKCNVGYAFLNFIEPYYCDLFWKKFAGRRLTGFRSRKVCDVSWGRVQGLKSNIEHYRNSSIMSLPCQEYKPLLFKNGVVVPFPPPNSQQQKHKQESPSTPPN